MTDPIPAGSEGLIPHLILKGAAEAVEFYKKAFGAEELRRSPAPDGKRLMHAELKIGGRPFYINDDFPEYCDGNEHNPHALGGSSVTIHQFVKDCDAAVKRAEDAGATVTMPPADMFWGDRYAIVTDPFGHQWSFGTHIADPTPEEMEQAMKTAFAGAG